MVFTNASQSLSAYDEDTTGVENVWHKIKSEMYEIRFRIKNMAIEFVVEPLR